MNMKNEIDYEYNKFLSDIKEPEFLAGIYMDEDEYENEYSHNDIYAAIETLEEMIKEYLHNNRPGQFVLISGWNIRVIKIEEARRMKWPEKRSMIYW